MEGLVEQAEEATPGREEGAEAANGPQAQPAPSAGDEAPVPPPPAPDAGWVRRDRALQQNREGKQSAHLARKIAERAKGKKVDTQLDDQISKGRLYACITSRPGQCGRADGYILEGKELDFYLKKMQKKRGKAAA